MKSPANSARSGSRPAPTQRPLVLLAAALGLGACLVACGRSGHTATGVAPASTPPTDAAASSNTRGLPPLAVAENFTRADNPTERLRWVRHPEQVAAAVAEFFSNGRGAGEKVASIKAMKPAETGAPTCARFAAMMTDGSQRLLCVVTTDGEAKVDFKAYARAGSVPWEDLLTGKAKEAAELRVFLQEGNYYNYGFAHEVRWQQITATSPDLETSLYFYIARNNPDAKLLEALDSKRPIPATVAIRALGDSHLKHQFEITKFLGTGWVLADELP